MSLPNAVSAQSRINPDRVVVGIGAAIIPTFEGADDMRVLPFPAIDVKQGRLFFNLPDGAGVLLVDNDVFSVGASVALVGGYRRRDVPTGIDRVNFAPGARLFAKARVSGFILSVGGTRALGGTDGIVADASIAYPIAASRRFILTPTVATTWANRRYMNRYFGVSAPEALASGLPQYEAGAGFKNVGGALNTVFVLSRRISLTGTIGATRVLNDAADSPINERRWNPTGFAGIAYRF